MSKSRPQDRAQAPLCIIIPAYNEAKRIGAVLKCVNDCICRYYSAQIMFMDDGSSDGTVEVAKAAQKAGIPIKIVQNRQNRGKGYTLQRAIRQIPAESIAIFMDGDGEHSPADIRRLVEPITTKRADVVIGSRFLTADPRAVYPHAPRLVDLLNGSYLNNQKKLGQIRRLGNMAFTLLILVFYRKLITDSQSGFRAFRPGVLQSLQLKARGFQIETEIAVKALNLGLRIAEVPIQSGKVGRGSYMKIVQDSVKIACTILEYALPTVIRLKFHNFLATYLP